MARPETLIGDVKRGGLNGFGSSFASGTIAGETDTIITSANNVNGIIVHHLGYSTNATASSWAVLILDGGDRFVFELGEDSVLTEKRFIESGTEIKIAENDGNALQYTMGFTILGG